MAENRELALVLKLVADQFQSELKKSQGALSGFNNFIKDWKTQLTAVGVTLFTIAKSTANYGDELVKAGQRMGTSIEETARLQHAAKVSDTDLQGLTSTVGILAKEMVQAAAGNAESSRKFEQLGISVRGSNGQLKGTTDILLEISDKFRLMPDGPEKTGLAMLALGKSASTVLPMLNSDLRAAFEEAEQLGLVMGEKDARAAEHFNDELTKLQGAIRGVTNDIGSALIPKFDAITHALTTIITDARKAGEALTGIGKAEPPQVGVVKPDGGGRNLRILPAPAGADKVQVDKFFPTEADEAHAAYLRELDRYQKNLQNKELDIISKRTMEDLQLLFTGANSLRKETESEVERLITALMEDNARTIEQINQDFAGDTKAERQVAEGRRIVARTQQELAAQERAQLVENLQAWRAYYDQVGGSAEFRYSNELNLVRATLAQQTQLTTEEAGRLLIAWRNHDEELAEMILNRTTLTEQQRETIELQALTRVEAANEQASDDVFSGWARGMQRYVEDTKSGFGLGADLARRTAQVMEQSFRTFFFDLFEGKVKSMQDVLQGFLGFVKQIAAQIASQLAVSFILKSFTSGGGGGFLDLFSGFFGGDKSGPSVQPAGLFGRAATGGTFLRKYAAGGPVLGFGNLDTIPALLTPGEYVLSRRDVSEIKQGIVGQAAAPANVTVNVIGAPQDSTASVDVRRTTDSMVIDVLLRHQRDLRPLFGGA